MTAHLRRGDFPRLWRAVEKARRRQGDYAGAEEAAEVARRVQGINAWVRDHGRRGQ